MSAVFPPMQQKDMLLLVHAKRERISELRKEIAERTQEVQELLKTCNHRLDDGRPATLLNMLDSKLEPTPGPQVCAFCYAAISEEQGS